MDYCYGELPYRSLRFEHEYLEKEKFQSVGTINYPNDYDYTRITEFKYLTGQRHPGTAIIREYPQPYERQTPGRDIPYYPIPQKRYGEIYDKYRAKLKSIPQLLPIGRLAEYKYYNMDQVVAKALVFFQSDFLES